MRELKNREVRSLVQSHMATEHAKRNKAHSSACIARTNMGHILSIKEKMVFMSPWLIVKERRASREYGQGEGRVREKERE